MAGHQLQMIVFGILSAFLWDDTDRDQLSEITRIMVDASTVDSIFILKTLIDKFAKSKPQKCRN